MPARGFTGFEQTPTSGTHYRERVMILVVIRTGMCRIPRVVRTGTLRVIVRVVVRVVIALVPAR